MVKNPSAVQETWVQSLGQKDPLEKEMVPHSSIPSWRAPWTEEPGGLHTVHVVERVTHAWSTNTFTSRYTYTSESLYRTPEPNAMM